MMNQHTLHLLTQLKLDGMARAFEEQASQTGAASLSFEERFGLLVDREFSHRDTKRVDRLLKQAKLKVAGACVEDIDYRAGRGLDKRLMASLSTCDWIRHAHSVLITGATDSTTWYTPRYVTETAWKADWVHLLAESPAGCVVP